MSDSAAPFSAAVLISGSGSNLQAFIDAVAEGSLNVRLAVVISNRAEAFGLERARRAGIDALCIDHNDFESRQAFDRDIARALDRYQPDAVILAGFMRILTPEFVQRYAGRMLNIHPSLLPKYPGLDTHRRAIDAGDAWHGSTVHFVTEELDGGPGIVQGRVPIVAGDDPDALAARVLHIEHRIYPHALGLLADGRIQFRDGMAWLDDEPLQEPIQLQQ